MAKREVMIIGGEEVPVHQSPLIQALQPDPDKSTIRDNIVLAGYLAYPGEKDVSEKAGDYRQTQAAFRNSRP